MTPLFLLAALAPGFLFSLQPSDRDKLRKLEGSGQQKLRNGDLDGAIADFSEAIKLDPTQANLWENRAQAWVQKKDLDQAITDFTRSIEQYLKDFREKSMLTGRFLAMAALSARADCKHGKGDVDGALSDHAQAIALDPKDTVPLIRRGKFKLKLKQYEAALSDFDKAVALRPASYTSWIERGKARYELMDYDGAIADYSKAIEIDPRNPAHPRMLGWIQYGSGRLDDAKRSLLRSCELSPSNQGYARALLFLVGARLGEREGAGKELSAHLDGRKDGSPEDWYSKVASYLLGRLSEVDFLKAADSGEKAQIPSQKCRAFFYVASLRLVDGRKDEAGAFFRKCVDTDQKGLEEHATAAGALKESAK